MNNINEFPDFEEFKKKADTAETMLYVYWRMVFNLNKKYEGLVKDEVYSITMKEYNRIVTNCDLFLRNYRLCNYLICLDYWGFGEEF